MVLNSMISGIAGVIVISILGGVGALILVGMKNTTTDTTALGILTNGLTALTTFSNQLNLIATVIGFGIVLLVVFRIIPNFTGGGSGE